MDLEQAMGESIERICGMPREQVSRASTLDELGIDSLAAAELITDLEIRLGVELPIDVLRRLNQVKTVGEILDYLHAALDGVPDAAR